MKKIILFLLTLTFLFLAACTSSTPTGNVVSEDDYIRIPVGDVSSDMIKLSHVDKGVKINFFVVKGADGKIRTAFDACDVCGGHEGYAQQGTDVRCKSCGRVFKIDDIGVLNSPGGCWPSFLDHKIENGEVLISKIELESGRYRFA